LANHGTLAGIAAVDDASEKRLRFVNVHEIALKINRLPIYVMPELSDYIDFLLVKHEKKTSLKPLQFKWEGEISALKWEYNEKGVGVALNRH
jgi:hypothetical protein